LVAAEVALALVLTIAAGLMMKSFVRLASVDPGFDSQNVLVTSVALPGPTYPQPEQRRRFFDDLLARIKTVPGVQSVGGTTNLPLQGGDNWMPFSIEGRPVPKPGHEPYVPFRVVTPDYFRTLRIPLRRGRFFTEADRRVSVPVIRWYESQPYPVNFERPQAVPSAIVSEAMAHQYWGNENPIGRRFRLLFSPWITIVGVVGDVKHGSLDAPTYPHVYMPYTQEPWGEMTLVARTSGPPLRYASVVRDQVRGLDVKLPVAITPMDDVLADSVGRQRFYVLLVSTFGGLALVLAAVGIFGLASYWASQRTSEIGVRMALGAQRSDVLRLIIAQGFVPALVGVSAGAAGALALTWLIKSLLFEVSPFDPMTFVTVALLFAGVAMLANYVPARRATKVDPMVALRYE
jgi:putative ABC transport system permease protein